MRNHLVRHSWRYLNQRYVVKLPGIVSTNAAFWTISFILSVSKFLFIFLHAAALSVLRRLIYCSEAEYENNVS